MKKDLFYLIFIYFPSTCPKAYPRTALEDPVVGLDLAPKKRGQRIGLQPVEFGPCPEIQKPARLGWQEVALTASHGLDGQLLRRCGLVPRTSKNIKAC